MYFCNVPLHSVSIKMYQMNTMDLIINPTLYDAQIDNYNISKIAYDINVNPYIFMV
jgi:hypothetical protein